MKLLVFLCLCPLAVMTKHSNCSWIYYLITGIINFLIWFFDVDFLISWDVDGFLILITLKELFLYQWNNIFCWLRQNLWKGEFPKWLLRLILKHLWCLDKIFYGSVVTSTRVHRRVRYQKSEYLFIKRQQRHKFWAVESTRPSVTFLHFIVSIATLLQVTHISEYKTKLHQIVIFFK